MTKRPCRLALAIASTVAIGCQGEANSPPSPQSLKPNVSQEAATSLATDAAAAQAANLPPLSGASQAEAAQTLIEPAAGTPAVIAPTVQAAAAPAAASPKPPAAAAPQDAAAGDGLPAHTMPIWKPAVAMSAAHADTCAVQVNDTFPALELQSLDGEAANLQSILQEAFGSGSRLAVVVFWNSKQASAQEQFSWLGEEVSVPFAKAGVKVVTVHVEGTAEEAGQFGSQPGESVTQLIAPTSEAWAAVASAKIPRTYLLDSSGKIVWMDIEYSAGTRRDLRNALMYHLTGAADAAE